MNAWIYAEGTSKGLLFLPLLYLIGEHPGRKVLSDDDATGDDDGEQSGELLTEDAGDARGECIA